jgi:hypothetical protein
VIRSSAVSSPSESRRELAVMAPTRSNAKMVPDLVKELVESFEPPAPKRAPDPWDEFEPPF